ncbi:MAG TPA: Hpt domain-containing protein, partial [Elusimicrobiales bacterium]|nr:Hpt domain-containing protein [Elusimicrobiales bacterium]
GGNMNKRQILEELGGLLEAVYDELVSEAYAQGDSQLSEISRLLRDGKCSRAAAIAHSIKGCFANLRLEDISSAAKRLEQVIKNGKEPAEITVQVSALAELLKSGES